MPTVTYKCPNCDGGLLFDPGTQKFHCEYCRSYFTKQELDGMASDANAAPEQPEPEEQPAQAVQEDESTGHAVAYSCPSCGAEIVTDETTAATFCVYCHNPVVLSGRLSHEFKPDKVIPFVLKKAEVEERFRSWCKKKRFIKRDFSSQSQMEKLSGVYFPYWLLNCMVDGEMRGIAKKVRTWRSGNTEYTETERYDIYRKADIDFEDIALTAIKREDADLTKGVYPYDFKKAVDFSMAYLSGFQADKRTLEKQAVQPEAQARLKEYTELLLRDTVPNYSSFSVSNLTVCPERENWEYILLPAWVLTYQYRNKTYFYAMNGQDGKVSGEVPLSFGRLAILFGVVAVVLFGLFMLGGWFLW